MDNYVYLRHINNQREKDRVLTYTELEAFAIYPDVENYCKGFCQQVKSKIREKYSKFSQYGLWTMGIILVVLFVRAAIIVEATK
ncbi:MAG: hypothetical protein IIT83_03355 [Bacteroidales bacterium]|nr:hypothetical protein [Bacteroidales bacterium]